MSHINVKLNDFEGPFDLLFHLIEKNEIDIYNIPISTLTNQYMEYINSFSVKDMDNMSEFLLMAATLLEIKSKMLLPKLLSKIDEEELDPRAELVSMLVEYKRFKKIIEVFKDKESFSKLVMYKSPEKNVINSLKVEEAPTYNTLLKGITLEKLYSVFQDVMNRRELTTDKIRSGFNSIKKDIFTVEQKMDFILDLIKLHKRIEFHKIFRSNSNKEEKIITFWAILELIKVDKINVSQNYIFGSILIMER